MRSDLTEQALVQCEPASLHSASPDFVMQRDLAQMRGAGDCYAATRSVLEMSHQGRKDLYAAGGSGHWPDIAAACLTPLRALPSAKGKLQGTPDNRPAGRSMSGIDVRRHSPAKPEGPHPV